MRFAIVRAHDLYREVLCILLGATGDVHFPSIVKTRLN